MTKAILFDLYKTLIDVENDEDRPETYEFLANWLAYRGVHIPSQRLQILYRAIVAEMLDRNPEPYPDVDIGQVFARIIAGGRPARPAKAPDLVTEITLLFRLLTTTSLTLYPQTIPLLETLHRRTRLALVSNAQRHFSLPEMKKFGLDRYFDRIVFSSDVQAGKPNPKIFHHVLALLDLQPPDVIFVGDDLFDDIWGANRLGLRTVWIERDRPKKFPAAFEKPTPDRQLAAESLADLPRLLAAMG